MDDTPLAADTSVERAPTRRAAITDDPRTARPAPHSEEVQRVHVEPEDRLAFRVGVNILTLALLVLAGYLVWRNFLQ
ncbi:MAG TPA: hypothetical protein VFF08_08945 [Trueperaceae bacterium]|nr:hypothetical protein [Trueperaceae bacterium]